MKPRQVLRPAPSARWTHESKPGSPIFLVQRALGGEMFVSNGTRGFEIPADTVQVFAEMVAAAAAWTDDDNER